MTSGEHAEVLSAAVLNPWPIEKSCRHGRGYYLTFGHGNPPAAEYREMWAPPPMPSTLRTHKRRWLAADRWLGTAIPYRVFEFIQTTPETKVAMYQRLRDGHHSGLREAILKGCEPMKDYAILKLSLSDGENTCKWVAEEGCGEYRAYVNKRK